MKVLVRSLIWTCIFFIQPFAEAGGLARSKMPIADPVLIQKWVLDSIAEMPVAGGYSLTPDAPKSMNAGFTWKTLPSGDEILELDSSGTIPSFCTTATYQVFYKVLQKYWAWGKVVPSRTLLECLKPRLEDDGHRIWGRWNANGPGTAKFAFDAEIGTNFDDLALALPGDFLKIYWNDKVGKLERGHSVVFLGVETRAGVPGIKFWSSNTSTKGYGEKWIPQTMAVRMVFTRLDRLENFENIAGLPEIDAFLESMLTRESTWEELKKVTGIPK